ncbi:nickel-dependent hydrogenase large subunit [Candidatus Roizmanbacteria bacterium]|nr:nickel-dependent hydrogenase large subunit [Candidatus Roizmanbacteria bacterium]
MHTGTLDLTLDQITKIEGHATLSLKLRDGKVEELNFSIAEFKRFYTQAVRGKPILAVPQMVARICGTCSNAHLLCSIKTIEASQGIIPSRQTVLLRRLLNNGLIIRDHGLHLYIFSLPDLYQKDSIFDFDDTNPEQHELVHDAFDVKESGNQLAIWSGGRSVHAPSPTIGGFSTVPDESQRRNIVDKLQAARPRVLKLIKLFKDCAFTLPENFSFSALQSNDYDLLSGDIVAADGGNVNSHEYSEHLEHTVIPYSQASGYKFKGNTFMVGALARLNLSRQFLHPKTKIDAADALSVFPSKNIFHNNLAQAIEILHAIDESLDILQNLTVEQEKPVTQPTKAGVGIGVIEAPRGTLYHRYEVDEKGIIQNARIIVPTGQNQIAIEQCLLHFVEKHADMEKEQLSFEFEKIVRAFDPCMSCASHFLKLKLVR